MLSHFELLPVLVFLLQFLFLDIGEHPKVDLVLLTTMFRNLLKILPQQQQSGELGVGTNFWLHITFLKKIPPFMASSNQCSPVIEF